MSLTLSTDVQQNLSSASGPGTEVYKAYMASNPSTTVLVPNIVEYGYGLLPGNTTKGAQAPNATVDPVVLVRSKSNPLTPDNYTLIDKTVGGVVAIAYQLINNVLTEENALENQSYFYTGGTVDQDSTLGYAFIAANGGAIDNPAGAFATDPGEFYVLTWVNLTNPDYSALSGSFFYMGGHFDPNFGSSFGTSLNDTPQVVFYVKEGQLYADVYLVQPTGDIVVVTTPFSDPVSQLGNTGPGQFALHYKNDGDVITITTALIFTQNGDNGSANNQVTVVPATNGKQSLAPCVGGSVGYRGIPSYGTSLDYVGYRTVIENVSMTLADASRRIDMDYAYFRDIDTHMPTFNAAVGV
jgi:hypothetical protein